MTDSGDPRRENEALSAAILRTSATLDLDTVLAEVAESARGLTGVRCGVMITVDETGAPQDSVFSGVTTEEQRELLAWPGSRRLWQHLRELPGPLRVADFPAYVRSLGIAPPRAFSRTFQGTPMRHRGADAGILFLAEKADGEAFTDEEEELLRIFVRNLRRKLGDSAARPAYIFNRRGVGYRMARRGG